MKFKAYEGLLERFLGPTRTVISAETLQVRDYDNYNMTMFDASERKNRHDTVFPLDCQKAFEKWYRCTREYYKVVKGNRL